MWRGAMATYPCVAINCEDSICPASGRASPSFTTFSSPGLTAPRQRSAFSVRSRARCLRRFWTQWNWRLRLCVHLEEHKVADPMIEAATPMMTTALSPWEDRKIQGQHRDRFAVVYVRQSTLQ